MWDNDDYVIERDSTCMKTILNLREDPLKIKKSLFLVLIFFKIYYHEYFILIIAYILKSLSYLNLYKK